MSPTGSFYNFLMAPKPKPQTPPYNKVAKYPVMTVEVETVLLREPSGRPAKKERKYPYYPVLERIVERVGDGGDSSSEGGKSGGGGDGDASSSAVSASSAASSSSGASSPVPKSSSSLTGWFSSGSSA